ncbi:MAG: LPS-assembly protein LptD, partial [Bacteroidaceae bacterium]
MAQVATDSIVGMDSVNVYVPSDSLVSTADSVPARRSNALDAPVIYESTDSMVWNYGGYASLYGDGKVNYQHVELTAAIIKMQMDSSLVYADGVRDSSGSYQGTPVFIDGSTPYESNHISYNFKTEKGYINEIITQQGEGYMTSNE